MTTLCVCSPHAVADNGRAKARGGSAVERVKCFALGRTTRRRKKTRMAARTARGALPVSLSTPASNLSHRLLLPNAFGLSFRTGSCGQRSALSPDGRRTADKWTVSKETCPTCPLVPSASLSGRLRPSGTSARRFRQGGQILETGLVRDLSACPPLARNCDSMGISWADKFRRLFCPTCPRCPEYRSSATRNRL
jgi:hypothetical protein